MEIIPAIDLLNGKCVRLNQGNYNEVTRFNSDPVKQAQVWEEQGAKRLHLVDLDGAKTGQAVNDQIIRKIKKSISIPIQLGGGIRNIGRAKELFEIGIDRIILGTIAIENPELVKVLSNEYPRKIAVGIDAREGMVATRGWLEQSKITSLELTKQLNDLELAAIISTDISTDGTLKGPNVQALKEIAQISTNPVIASGGIGSIADLISLANIENEGIEGIIVGRALYDGSIELKEALITLKNLIIQDSFDDKDKFFV
ncbi:1-(5-phosphoribosyl)-5-[(5-phosphoribosylamino)methylideneamino]imidazole-4-carboxamide isomerase [Prochlorococcus marinus]|uniref:1-(5-phosphoribosyl)-5-[(5-phosphoribosylamino)methylideneamino] imidazole-4-carboxamide isomerase n=1 Tax=Prochlorococcus marinus XMU1408 TaxID=2213228 RepID=A0A318R5Y9_PROMR|nr:1-(5-phosphoribosyl)-5-[(5-phosphoribosylamino)methylideneamino]imidazole-4-carboxamide isomerase [Prochlorococcus marinus]MBW3041800.1 1-(5-phosphoribosyl)-5-[(5-phosphoribosylamino)methylideneamino]imidazole-4-carboxamide isomerase [Prochlorococcus marinus str. XMU1408]PYE02941.1 1-(5-phosphoribosyl)-5-[(5-phosphoribosylamino)methylideneamino]imidazole-4-carboxamide isomerase [Prochlorococcus marinus XMU1408]